MFCPQCGYKNEDDAKFCESCGVPFKKSAPSTNFASEDIETKSKTMSEVSAKKLQNKKIVLVTVIVIVLISLGMGAYFIVAHQQKAKANEAYAAQISAASKAEDSKNYDAAITDYQVAIQQRPDDAKAYIGLADAYIGKNDYENAAKILQTGYTITKSTEIYSKLSEVNKKLEEIKAAGVAKKKAEDEAKAKETEYNSQLTLGDKYLAAKDYDNAITAYQKAIEAKPNESKPYIGLADVYRGKNDLTSAINILTKEYNKTQNLDLKAKISLFHDLNEWEQTYKATIKNTFSADMFWLFDMDKNGIPELFLHQTDSEGNHIMIYTYQNGNLKNLGDVHSYGDIYKSKDGKIVIDGFVSGGFGNLYVCTLTYAKFSAIKMWCTNEESEESEESDIYWKVSGKNVSKAESDATYKDLTAGGHLKPYVIDEITDSTDLSKLIN